MVNAIYACVSFRYLQEIGYTDTIIDVRSNRVRSLLGLNDMNDMNEENRSSAGINGGDVSGQIGRRGGDGGQAGSGRKGVTALAEEMMLDTEASVIANFDFLSSEVSILLSIISNHLSWQINIAAPSNVYPSRRPKLTMTTI